MKEYYSLLKEVALFKGFEAPDLEVMFKCLGAIIQHVRKDETILFAGDKPEYVGVVLSGQFHIIRDDFDGNRSLLAAIPPCGIFAEALCCAGVEESPVTVTADTDSTVMLLKFSHILHNCQKTCSLHTNLIENMLGIVANKNLRLQDRMEIISMKSVRAKVMRYLESFGSKQGQEFVIPFNREKMADFLCVERSALSHELARMKKDGLIDYKKNKFVLQ